MSRSTMARRVAIGFVASATAVAALAGCGGSSTSNTSSQPVSGSSSKSATKAASGGGELKGAVNVCALMPPATLSQITGKTFQKAEPDNTPSYQLYNCNYSTDPTSGGVTAEQLNLDILGKGGAVGLKADVDAASQVKSSLTTLHPVSGIGDKAYGGGIEARLEVLYGDTLIKISGLTEITEDQGKQIISQLHSKL